LAADSTRVEDNRRQSELTAAVTMVVDAVEVIAGVLAVLVVQRTTRRQEARAARLAQPA
jgi:hypothetical protein